MCRCSKSTYKEKDFKPDYYGYKKSEEKSLFNKMITFLKGNKESK